jgi:hypothetical protein
VIDRDPLALDEFPADHLHRALRDFYLAHLVEMMSHRALVNLRDDDLNLDQMVVMKVDRLMDDQNYSVCLNYRDALPCTHSLITIQI